MANVTIAWPPLRCAKGYATCGQNRQFQWFKNQTNIYPMVQAQFATMLMKKGHKVMWLDALAENFNEVEFGRVLCQKTPDYMILEAQTPIVKEYWTIIDAFKNNLPQIKIILVGDHVTALPEESKKNCKADYIIEGGKWHYKAFKIIHGSEWDINEGLPLINRNSTYWWHYAYRNGNFKYVPGTYIMSALDCWYAKCRFCSWATYHKSYDLRQPDDVLAEIEMLIQAGFKEIFDDSGTFPIGEWFDEFCNKFIERGYQDYVVMGCNMRFGSLKPSQFELLKKCNFRMILWGLESANQRTLDLLKKGYKVAYIKDELEQAKQNGLDSHLTVMFGYPWETEEEARNTYNYVRKLLLDDMAFSAQATICVPYPGTPLYKHCKEQDLLLTDDWNDYDMSKPVMKTIYPEELVMKFQRGIYNTSYHPKFIWNKLKRIRSFDDLKYYFRIGKKIYDRFGNFYSKDLPTKS